MGVRNTLRVGGASGADSLAASVGLSRTRDLSQRSRVWDGLRGRDGRRRAWLSGQWSLPAPADLQRLAETAEAQGRTPVVWDGQIRAVIVVSDTIKAGSAKAIAERRNLGLRRVLLKGDNTRADHSGRPVGTTTAGVIAEVLPANKVDVVRLHGLRTVVAIELPVSLRR